jgi:hypothetical protein
MRVWPYSSTSITDERPAMAPIFTRTANHGRPIALTAFAIGAGSFSSVVGHDANQHRRGEDVERSVQTTSEPMMPIGMSRAGSRASAPAVETASKPI